MTARWVRLTSPTGQPIQINIALARWLQAPENGFEGRTVIGFGPDKDDRLEVAETPEQILTAAPAETLAARALNISKKAAVLSTS